MRIRTNAMSQAEMMENLPPALQLDVRMHLCEGIIHEVPLFQSASIAAVRSIAARLTQKIYMEGDVIVHEGEVGREMYFIHSVRLLILSSPAAVEAGHSNASQHSQQF